MEKFLYQSEDLDMYLTDNGNVAFDVLPGRTPSVTIEAFAEVVDKFLEHRMEMLK